MSNTLTVNRARGGFLIAVDAGGVTENRMAGGRLESRRKGSSDNRLWGFVRCNADTRQMGPDGAGWIERPEAADTDPGPWTWSLTDEGREQMEAYKAEQAELLTAGGR